MKTLRLLIVAAVLVPLLSLSSCIEDGFTTLPSDQPTFSVDTLKMGTVITDQSTTTHRFTVYNRASKGINISRIALSGADAALFRLNVDGFSGTEFSDVEIRAKDSIFILVEATLPDKDSDLPVKVEAALNFLTNGVDSKVIITATGRDVRRLDAVTLTENTTLTANRPYLITDSLVVAPGATLTIEPGAELMFHDAAKMIVRGTLKAVGDVDKEITFRGDRTGYVAAQIPFDIMSRQWQGMFFTSTSRDNELSHCAVINTVQGVTVDGSLAQPGEVTLKMIDSRLRNSGGSSLEVYHADIAAYGCEFAEAAEAAVLLHGGSHIINQCTIANYYLFTAISRPLLTLEHVNADDDDASGLPYTRADIANTIIYGLGSDISHGDLTGTNIMLRSCLLKSEGSDDDNFINCVWGEDPLFYTVREDYVFDYRLHDDSPAIGAGDASLTAPEAAVDILGNRRTTPPDLGAYVHTADTTK